MLFGLYGTLMLYPLGRGVGLYGTLLQRFYTLTSISYHSLA